MGTHTLISGVLLLAWALLWSLGGFWIARSAFRLERGELLGVGLAGGLAAENLFANLLGRFLPLPFAFWLAAGLVCLGGLGLALRDGWRNLWRFPFPWGSILGFGLVSLIAFAIGRGYGIFDDFMQLSTISTIAAGSIPPRFALDPSVPYDYHFFLLLFSGQLVRVGDLNVWTASDLAHGLATGLALLLAFHWTRRATRSKTAGFLGAAFLLFASGTRWILLFLPSNILKALGAGLTLLGSGAGSGANLGQALLNNWAVEGAGPIPFPFAFANGIFPPGVLNQFSVNSLLEAAFVFALLLCFTRWRSTWRAILASALIFSSTMLLTEVGVVLGIGSWAVVGLASLIQRRSLRLPRTMWIWLATLLSGHLLGALQGGALVGIAAKVIAAPSATSYHSVNFLFTFPPAIVSSHLGILSLANPGQVVIALAEIGPILLAFPLLIAWGWKAYRAGRWLEAALAAEAVLSLGMIFVQYTGSEGVRNTSRLYRFIFILGIFAVPAGWNWAIHRSPSRRWIAAIPAAAAMLGGVVLFGIELPAMQKPVYTYFITELDARISSQYWNKLEANALVFDPVPYRGPTVLGRFTNSSDTWYSLKPAWKTLFKQPLPSAIHAAGFSYAYFDNFYYRDQIAQVQTAWNSSCAHLIAETSDGEFWRRLYDIKDCQ